VSLDEVRFLFNGSTLTKPKKLFLFDIDGTLLASGGAGWNALEAACAELFGTRNLAGIDIAGRTDSSIARQLFARHGWEATAENCTRFFDTYLAHLAQLLPQTKGTVASRGDRAARSVACPDRLRRCLAHGNLARGAELKLTHYGLWHYFDFGAYADDHHDRNELGPVARARAKDRHGLEFAAENIFVLGDTPHDVACARAIGAKAVAIATGRHSRAELEASSPDYLFDDLSDVAGVLHALGLRAGHRCSGKHGRFTSIQGGDRAMTAEPAASTKKPRPWLPRFAAREVEVHDHDRDHDDHHAEAGWRLQLVASGVCLVCAILGYVIHQPQVSLGFYTLSYVAGAWFTVGEVKEKLHDGVLDVHFLMLAVAAGAAAIGRWGEGSVLLFLFSASSALEHYAMDRTQRAIHSLLHSAPKTATVIAPWGGERQVAVEELTPGLRLLVRPGELFPVDGEVAKGETAADESNLTGEAIPIAKDRGDAGARRHPESQRLCRSPRNAAGEGERAAEDHSSDSARAALEGALAAFHRSLWIRLHVWRACSDCGDVFRLVADLSSRAIPLERRGAERLLSSDDIARRGLAMRSGSVNSLCHSRRHRERGTAWILFRGGAAVEQLGEIRLVAMDKTGTLTTGDLRIEKVESFPPGSEGKVLEMAAALDHHSNHPIARAIVRYAKKQGIEPRQIDVPTATFGAGVSGTVDGQEVRLGKRAWVSPNEQADTTAGEQTAIGASEVWLRADGLHGRLLLRDDVRPEARGLIETLRQAGVRTLVLTGDRQASADRLVRELSVDEVRAELKPEQKLAVIEEFTRNGEKIAMIGDGVNDAPSIAAAHVGVAMGARGSDAALEQADVVLMHDKLENFLAAYKLSRRASRVIRQNVGISLGVIAVLVSFALFERIALPLGVLGHEGSTLVVVLNSLRLLAAKR
jgi:Cd2+/Zn2+-exporting ATPase